MGSKFLSKRGRKALQKKLMKSFIESRKNFINHDNRGVLNQKKVLFNHVDALEEMLRIKQTLTMAMALMLTMTMTLALTLTCVVIVMMLIITWMKVSTIARIVIFLTLYRQENHPMVLFMVKMILSYLIIMRR